MKEIVQHENEVLRKKAESVDPEHIGSEWLNDILENMKAALASQPDGVAIAAPQIGYSLRIFVVSGTVYDRLYEVEENTGSNGSDLPEEKRRPDRVFINPEIIKSSREKDALDEGCLSVRNYYGLVPRHRKVTVRALDERGQPFTEGRSGLLAQIFQHEIDHLNGVLFIDKARDVEYREPEEN